MYLDFQCFLKIVSLPLPIFMHTLFRMIPALPIWMLDADIAVFWVMDTFANAALKEHPPIVNSKLLGSQHWLQAEETWVASQKKLNCLVIRCYSQENAMVPPISLCCLHWKERVMKY